jgi:hypothetical protein
MYRSGVGHQNSRSLRTQPPYEAHHMPWYENASAPTPEQRYYVAHADRLISNWNSDRIPANVRAQLKALHSPSSTSS